MGATDCKKIEIMSLSQALRQDNVTQRIGLSLNGDKLLLFPERQRFAAVVIVISSFAIILAILYYLNLPVLLPAIILSASIVLFVPLFLWFDTVEVRKGPYLEINLKTGDAVINRQNKTLKLTEIAAVRQFEMDCGGDSCCEMDFIIKTDGGREICYPILLCSSHDVIIKNSRKVAEILGVPLEVITNDRRGRDFATLKVYNDE